MASGNDECDSNYDNIDQIDRMIKSGRHRDIIGGMWDKIGHLQRNFLVENGLKPSHHLLDIGCGSLRGGVHFTRYLEPAHYWGIDISESLLTAGYEQEIVPEGLASKLPRTNLITDGEFTFARFGRTFDMAIAQSVFTHINENKIKLCLQRLSDVIRPEGRLFATFFLVAEDLKADQPFAHPNGVVTFSYKDPFHYRLSDVEGLVRHLPWRIKSAGDWNHPRDQKMVIFERFNESTGVEIGKHPSTA